MSDVQIKEKPDLSELQMSEDAYKPRRARRLSWFFVLILGPAAAAYYFLPLTLLAPQVEITQARILTTTQASTVLTASGYTYARGRASVGAKIIGRIEELLVDEGDSVQAGDIIASLDSEDLKANLRLAEASLAEASARLADSEREFLRQSRLIDEQLTSQALYDAAITQRDVAVAQLGTAQARVDAALSHLDYTIIRAPISGVVIERNIEVGEMVAPGGFATQQSTGYLVRLADPSSLEIEADINESYIARLRIGQPATIRVDAVPDFEYSGKLRQIVPTADRQRAVVQVKVSLDNWDRRLVPDMSSTVVFLEEDTGESALPKSPKVLVPSEAIQYQNDFAYVFRVQNEQLLRTRITLGPESEGFVEVLDGLSGGETIVRRDVNLLENGSRVRVLGR
ncbi:MAG: hypothetical protein CMM56_05510 [Rhodospirillaceae bacterium]|nr:hypothetical protein [Rhodospirillaceae bacterium]|tara:strand:- start:437 stop:1630 length:1194 start_codon:yes stop_codon:yes gene_type:complete